MKKHFFKFQIPITLTLTFTNDQARKIYVNFLNKMIYLTFTLVMILQPDNSEIVKYCKVLNSIIV